jgi:hypothetical protein
MDFYFLSNVAFYDWFFIVKVPGNGLMGTCIKFDAQESMCMSTIVPYPTLPIIILIHLCSQSFTEKQKMRMFTKVAEEKKRKVQ